MKRAPLALLLVMLLLPLGTTGHSEAAAAVAETAPQSWTIMLYMADDYGTHLPWQQNIADMEAAGRAPGTTVVALVDPLGDGNSVLLRVDHGSNSTIDDGHAVIPLTGEVNMASPDTLVSFINFSASTFPSDRLVLVLWGHADTWIGLCPDGTDILTLPELGSALSNSTAKTHRIIDLVAVDACSVASVEMLYQLDSRTSYFVASEKDIPFEGLPYRAILDDLAADPGQSTASVGRTIVHDYTEWARYNSTYSSSMALFNMSRFDDFALTLDVLARQGARYDSLFHDDLVAAFQQAEKYETSWYVDLGDLLSKLAGADLPPELRMMATAVTMTYAAMVERLEIHDLPDPIDGIHVRLATGAVICAPSIVLPDTMYANLTIAATPWYDLGRLIRRAGGSNTSGDGPTLSLVPAGSSAPYSVSLQWPTGAGQVEAWVFATEPGGYRLLGTYSSTSGAIRIDGIAGNLVISATALRSGVATSYSRLEATVPVQITLDLTILKDGVQTNDGYTVKISIGSTTFDTVAENGKGEVSLIVPAQADVEALVHIRVYDRGSGALVGSQEVFLKMTDMSVSVEVFEGTAPNGFPWPLLAIAMLPGALLLLFAVSLWIGTERKDPEDDLDL